MLWSRFREFMGRDSVVGIVTRFGLGVPEIGSRWGARFSAPVQTGPRTHPASCIKGTVFLPGEKQSGQGVDNPPPSSAEVKVRVVVYLYTPSGLSCSRVNCNLSFTPISCLLRQVRCQCCEVRVRPEIPKVDSLPWEEALPSCAVLHQYLLDFKIPSFRFTH